MGKDGLICYSAVNVYLLKKSMYKLSVANQERQPENVMTIVSCLTM
jgi:hypothetical protein